MTNHASYKPGTFTIDVSNFEIGKRLFHPRDMPAFLHEYCHYIQDVTTISSIFGFSLWLFDIANLTNIFSNGTGKTIMLPLSKDANGNPINQYRKFYNVFCGNSDDVFAIDYKVNKFQSITFEISELPLTNWTPSIRLNRIHLEGRTEPLQFRLIALQEIHAYYAQKISESFYPNEEFPYPADVLPSYPYRFGEHLFEAYGIHLPLQTKFHLVGMCLDTIQAPTVFLLVLEAIKGRTFDYDEKSLEELSLAVETARVACSYSAEEALEQIMPDLKRWAKGPGRTALCIALEWYILQVENAYRLKSEYPHAFNNFFCQGIGGLSTLYVAYPAPAFWNNGALDGNAAADKEPGQDSIYKFNHEAASTFWALRILYDFLCAPDFDSLQKHSVCLLYDRCLVRPELGEDHTCKVAPWEIVRGKTKPPCIYGEAAASMGLWQNQIDFIF